MYITSHISYLGDGAGSVLVLEGQNEVTLRLKGKQIVEIVHLKMMREGK